MASPPTSPTSLTRAVLDWATENRHSSRSAAPALHRLRTALSAVELRTFRALVAGPMSVGKSSLVSALWGDATLLPTAARDCTQTDTLLRPPEPGEAGRSLLLHYLTREEALDFALRGLSFHRLTETLGEELGVLEVELQLQARPPRERLEWTARTFKDLLDKDPKARVLYDHLVEELEALEEFFSILDDPAYPEGSSRPAPWDQREAFLMGLREPDGRKVHVGRLLALRRVDLVCPTQAWAKAPPLLIDTPMVPPLRNARRAELLLQEACGADLLVLLAVAKAWQPEPWLTECFQRAPHLRQRTLLVFNQLDTVDRTTLLSHGGLRGDCEAACRTLADLGLPPENLYFTCARLPFLKLLEQQAPRPFIAEAVRRLEGVLARLRADAASASGLLKERLLAACEGPDGGLDALRQALHRCGAPGAEQRAAAEMTQVLQQELAPLAELPAPLRKALQELPPAEG